MKKHLIPVSLMFLVYMVFLFLFYYPVVSNLNHVFFRDYEDGIKNYYTPAYHIQNDKSFSHFEGMNYPFGEHVVFTDNQPILSNAIKTIAQVFPNITNYTIGILNFAMLFSIFMTAFFLYLICLFFKTDSGIIESLFCISVALLTPQLLRLGGHYALSYGFILPLIWWLSLLFLKKPSFKISFIICLSLLIASGLHLYYLILAGGFLFLQLLLFALINRKTIQWSYFIHFAIQLVLPALVLFSWLKLFSTATHRPQTPGGFFDHTTFLEGVFLPIGMPLENFFKWFVKIRPIPWEGLAYIGLFATIFCIFLIITFVYKGFQRLRYRKPLDISLIQISLWSSGILLLYSFGFPFIYKFKNLFHYIGPLQQFRGVGRFAWPFFYVINIFAFLYLTKLLGKRKMFLMLPILLMLYEAFQFHKLPFIEPTEIPELTRKEEKAKHWSGKINFAEYQAIIPLPYYHIGSENLGILPKGEHILKQSIIASLNTGLPLLSVHLSRTDILQTNMNLQLFYENLSLPEILEKFPNRKKILIVHDPSETLSPTEMNLLNFATKINSDSMVNVLEIDLYAYYKHQLSLNFQQALKALEYEMDDEVVPFLINNTYSEVNNTDFLPPFQTYKEIQINKIWYTLESFQFKGESSKKIVFSFWCYFNQNGVPNSTLIIEGKNAEGEFVFWEDYGLKEHVKCIENGWALIEDEFEIQPGANYVFLMNNIYLKTPLKIQHFMVRESEQASAIRKAPFIWYNNRFYRE